MFAAHISLRGLRNGIYVASSWAVSISYVSLLVLSASLKADAQEIAPWSESLGSILLFLQNWAWILILILLIVSLLAKIAAKFLGPSWIWRGVHQVLNDFREHVFGARDDAQHHHRATLFQHKFDWGPLPGWLFPVERSGYTTRRGIPIFKAPPDRPEQAQGVAGTAWVQGRTILVNDLPSFSSIEGEILEEEIREYAERSFVNFGWVWTRKPRARSLCGIPVEVAGRPWGVLVLDSVDPQGIQPDYESFRLVAKCLGKLLEGV